MTVNVASEDEHRAEVGPRGWRPRLVATDLDGTIIGPEGEISDRTVRALQRVEELGVPVVFVTGRPPRRLRVVSERTGHTGLAICANGAIVSKRHQDSQRLSNRARAAIAKGQERSCVRVKHDHVGFVSRRKRTDAVFECERARTA